MARLQGLRKIGWQVLRHTFASHLVMKGVPLKAVQELMGHANDRDDLALLAPDRKSDAVRCSCSIGMAIPWQRAPPRRPTNENETSRLMEAAGIEPGHLDRLGAGSRGIAQNPAIY